MRSLRVRCVQQRFALGEKDCGGRASRRTRCSEDVRAREDSKTGLGGSQELMERRLRAWVGGTGVSAEGRQNRSRGATETQRGDAGAVVRAEGDWEG